MLRKKVFLIDDEKDILEIFKELYENEKVEILTFSNHVEALEKAQIQKPDLILIDKNLKKHSGLEVVKLFDSSIKKILCTGDVNIKNVPEGFFQVLPKPCSLKEIQKIFDAI